MKHASTLVTELGREPHNDCGSVNPPIHRTSTIIFDSFNDMRAYESGKSTHFGYGRSNNETTDRFAKAIATLEGGDYSVITSSGLAATVVAILACVSNGDHLLVTDSIYASTRKFIEDELVRRGVEITFYDPAIGADIAALIKPNTKAVYVESPGSLTFEMQDIPAIAKAAHAKGALVIADCTWGTSLYQRPFEMGVDISVQSASKYISGHSDLVMGTVTCKNALKAAVKRVYLHYGMTPGTDNVYLALRGLRTMAVRLKQHETSTLKIASWLEQRPEVARVLYPALPSHPQHALFKRDLTGATGLFAFELKDGTEAKMSAFIDTLHHFGIGYSWGGYESLAIAYQPAKQRSATDWAKDCWLIRLHIGLEDADTLIEDLEKGFAAANT